MTNQTKKYKNKVVFYFSFNKVLYSFFLEYCLFILFLFILIWTTKTKNILYNKNEGLFNFVNYFVYKQKPNNKQQNQRNILEK